VWCPWCILMDRDTYTNVGLSIAKWIAEAHQGKISVVSKVGEGSVFRVQIPLSEEGL
jgi:signal transduction histidine kinase